MRTFECINCGARSTMSDGMNPGKLRVPNEHGVLEPAGCPFCGSLDYRPIFPQLPPESEEAIFNDTEETTEGTTGLRETI